MERIDKLIKTLKGTAKDFDKTCLEMGFDTYELSQEEYDYLYDHIFQCERCGMWRSIHNGECGLCYDCQDDIENNGEIW